jgi:TatD DNase family protein
MGLIDTHSHIDMIDCNAEDIIREAKEFGVEKIIVPSVDETSYEKVLDLSKKFDEIYCAIGIHPTEVLKASDYDLIYKFAKNDKVVAIGEIGLDYYWDKTYVDAQKKSFIHQVEIARELKLPILIHDREAHFDTFEILKDVNDIPVVMHCFSGSLEFANQCIEKGFYIAFGGVLTFKNAKKMKEVAKSIPLEYILLETDAPYLTPDPFRGKENHPSYVKFVAQQLAALRNMDFDEIVNVTCENAKRIFKF